MINDKVMRRIINATMPGKLILNDGETEESIINEYFSHPKHKNYIIDDEVNGFLCITEYDDFIVVNFAWHIGSFSTQRKMVRLGKALYKMYTLDKKLPMYYSGKTNLYSNHSIEIDDNTWQFIP